MLPRLLRRGADYAEAYAAFADDTATQDCVNYANTVRMLAEAYAEQEREDGNPYV